ncbi:hypothetical protein PHISCL_00151 [Aspergillus sclerotialis]|uniref:Uncharacterized protein n=1 Tax=Aspergillus sclerotialis TaxID=2070753 RepID=A0A3A3AC41_9EURO|nr:hypothetical protein PHISCL_00151 [Aspergillus sclerotialis]
MFSDCRAGILYDHDEINSSTGSMGWIPVTILLLGPVSCLEGKHSRRFPDKEGKNEVSK